MEEGALGARPERGDRHRGGGDAGRRSDTTGAHQQLPAGDPLPGLADLGVELLALGRIAEVVVLLLGLLLRDDGLAGERQGDADEDDAEAGAEAEQLRVRIDGVEDGEADEAGGAGEQQGRGGADRARLGADLALARRRDLLGGLALLLPAVGERAPDAGDQHREEQLEQLCDLRAQRAHSVVLSPIRRIVSSSATPASSQATMPSGIGPM